MCIQHLLLLPVLIVGLAFIPAGQVTAQTFTNLYSFTETVGTSSINSDGAYPTAGLIASGSALYGVAQSGGSSGKGSVFRVNADGTAFTTLHIFTGGSNGATPAGQLVLSGDTLYGTTSDVGSSHNGTVFKVNTDGTAFTTLHNFTSISGPASTNSDGAWPVGVLILSSNTLFGTAQAGGTSSYGTVFRVNTTGAGFANPHNFSGYPSDGSPEAGLVLSGNTLYGTAYDGGSSHNGTVFKVNTDGTAFTTLHNFTAMSGPASTNSDGANPYAELIFAGGTLYGTTQNGGTAGTGTVFAVTTDGWYVFQSYSAGGEERRSTLPAAAGE